MLEALKKMIGMTVQGTIAKLGFMPDDCGDKVKKISECKDPAAVMALGCMLDDCVKIGNYDFLSAQLKTIPDAGL